MPRPAPPAHGAELRGQEELQKLAGAIEVYDTDFKTGNEALDIVLMEKGLLCQREKVRMTCLVNGVHLNGMKQATSTPFFCNALENAMESVEALNERGAISITELCRDDFFVIRIENFFSGKMEFQDGLPVTRKDRGYHGFGVEEHEDDRRQVRRRADLLHQRRYFPRGPGFTAGRSGAADNINCISPVGFRFLPQNRRVLSFD